jgi:hypothetical protein
VLLHRGDTTIVSVRIRSGGAALTPDSGTLDVYRPSDVAFASALVLTPGTTSTATVPLIAASEDIGIGWWVRLTVVISGQTYSWRHAAILVGDVPSPLIDDEDLYVEQAELRRRIPEGQTNWNPQEDEAWAEIFEALCRGRKPWLTIDGTALRHAHKLSSLAKACGTIVSENGHFERAATDYGAIASRAIDAIQLTYETAREVHVGSPVTRRGERGRCYR